MIVYSDRLESANKRPPNLGMVARRNCHRKFAPAFIDLFSGAGLFAKAFHSEGFIPVGAYELDANAAATHALNVSKKICVGNLSKILPSGRCDVLIAGPPCQGFSSIGAKLTGDPRNSLCLMVPLWAKLTAASIVVVENVAPFLETNDWKAMCRLFERSGYSLKWWTLNARNYGVAQNRSRSFTVASKIGEIDPLLFRLPSTTVREAFRKLPRYPHYSIQHYAQPQSEQALERIRLIPAGGDIRDLAIRAPALVPPSWFKTGGKVVDIWGRLDWDGVSNVLRTGFLNPSRGRFLHPKDDRPISFREAARLQSLPDDFIFAGTPQQIARQIGNGVPLNLGRAIAKAIRALFA